MHVRARQAHAGHSGAPTRMYVGAVLLGGLLFLGLLAPASSAMPFAKCWSLKEGWSNAPRVVCGHTECENALDNKPVDGAHHRYYSCVEGVLHAHLGKDLNECKQACFDGEYQRRAGTENTECDPARRTPENPWGVLNNGNPNKSSSVMDNTPQPDCQAGCDFYYTAPCAAWSTTACAFGKFNAITDRAPSNTTNYSCQDCQTPAGHDCPASISHTEGGWPCAAGKFSKPSGPCTNCTAGFYQPQEGNGTCIVCGKGRFSSGKVGQAGADAACPVCAAGTFSNQTGSMACINCPAGKNLIDFGSAESAHDSAEDCEDCPSKSYNPFEGLHHECFPCPFGNSTGSLTCEVCPPGKWRQGSLLQSKCYACPAGYVQEIADSTFCMPCFPGTFQNEDGQSSCKPCLAGRYQPKLSATDACSDCVSGRFSNTSQAGQCTMCPAGKWGGIGRDGQSVFSDACHDCPLGKHSAAEGTSFTAECDDCAKGKFANRTGVTACIECPMSWFEDGKASQACKVCPFGWTAPKDSQDRPINGSANCRSLNFVTSCSGSDQYLNSTDSDPNEWKCEQCPPGGACEGEDVTWENIGNLFGWWKIPVEERVGNSTLKSTPAFAECMSLPACLGHSNRALEGRFFDTDGRVDLALIKRNTTVNGSSLSNQPCATNLGFRNSSRLCHECNATSRRVGDSRCTPCPPEWQQWGLIVLVLLFATAVVCIIVGSTICDAGEQKLSSGVQKILLNYLQGAFAVCVCVHVHGVCTESLT